MGYYTNYSLEIEQPADYDYSYRIGVLSDLRNTNEHARYALCEDGSTREGCKWYDHEEDMINFSRKYPEASFTLSGIGEEAGDFWKITFMDGKIISRKRGVITYVDVS